MAMGRRARSYLPSAAAIEKVPRGGKRRRSQREKIQRKKIMRNPTPYLKMRVLGAIDMAAGNSIQARIRAVSQMTFSDEEGHARQFTWRTIQTWYTRYQKHGVTVMENKPRSDKGKIRKVTLEDVLEAVRKVLPKVHGKSPTRATLYRLCIEEGLLIRSQIAPNTFRRIVKQYELLKPDADCSSKLRLAFAKAHANEMWQADTLVGPYIQHEGSPLQTRLIAFLDDASRVCCHGQFFLAENVDTLIKGKIERFFRTLRDQFLSRALDLCSLDVLNRQFIHWVEEHYNAQKHSVLEMTPLDRFALDRSRVRYLPPNQANDELFFVEEDRTVRADNTFSFKSIRFEAPRHLPERTIQIRFERKRPTQRVIVYYKAERMGEARPLDPVANDRKPSTAKVNPATQENQP